MSFRKGEEEARQQVNRCVSVCFSELGREKSGSDPLITQLRGLHDKLLLSFVEVFAQLGVAEEKLTLGPVATN